MGTRILIILMFICSVASGQGLNWLPIPIGGPTTGTFTFVQSTTKTPTGTNATFVTSNAITTTGNFAAIVISDYTQSPLGTMTDSKGNVWNMAVSKSGGGTNTARSTMFYSNMTSIGSGHTFTYTATGTCFPTMYVEIYQTTRPVTVDQTNGFNGTTGTSIQPGSVSPTKDNELIVVGLSATPITSVTGINSGFTISNSNASGATNTFLGGGMAHLIQTVAGSVNPTWTVSGSPTLSAATIVTFKQ